MSIPRPSGLKVPSKIGKPSGLPQTKSGIPAPGSLVKAQSPELPEPPPPVDDFIIGDRVWVSGTKPGYIAFLGETRFAAGEWAGVVLDEPVGKNDGSIQGVRYFQCPSSRGVFSKISKLSRTPGRMAITTPTPKPDDIMSDVDLNVCASNGTTNSLPRQRPTTPRTHFAGTRMSSGSTSSLNKSVSPANSTANFGRQTPSKGGGFKVGDRVLVSGSKPGTLRYLGETDFAKGEWAGVELDDKLGKNDGAVAGKRYFDCQPMFGLFAPVHKVTRPPGPGYAGGTPQTKSGLTSSMRLTRERSGSQESISSLSSTASSVSRSRAKTGQRPSTLNVSATTSALQKALKEKEEHIEQLLRERDLERSEVARAAAQIDDTENQLSRMKSEQERYQGEVDESVLRMQDVIQTLEQKNRDLNEKLEDERRKVEDLQFQIEEEMLAKDDMTTRTGEEDKKIEDFEKMLKREKERAGKMEQEIGALKLKHEQQANQLKSSEETATTYLDQMEELTHKLTQAENKIRTFESSRLEEGAKTSQVSMELVEKNTKVQELEDLIEKRNKELAHLHIKLGEVEEELKASREKRDKLQENCDSLTNRLNASEDAAEKLNSEILDLRNQVSDLHREVQAGIERNEQLTDEKNKQERQIDELMRNSGNSSEQLSLLSDQVKEKTRKVEDLQANLSSSTQKWAKLNEQFDQLKQEKDKEKHNITCKYEENINVLKAQLEDVQKEVEKSKNKMKKMSEDFEKDKEDSVNRKVDEINELKKQLQNKLEELSKQEIQTQAHKEVLDQITLEKEAFKFEKEKVEKHLKRVETEKEAMNHELIQAKVEMSKIQSKWTEMTGEIDSYKTQVEDLKSEQEHYNKTQKELIKQRDDALAEKKNVSGEQDKLSAELLETKASLQQKEIRIEELQKQFDSLNSLSSEQKAELEKFSGQAAIASSLQTQLDEVSTQMASLQEEHKQSQAENDSMRAQLEFYNLLAEEKSRLENQNTELNKKMEEMELRHSEHSEQLQTEKEALSSETENLTALIQKQEEELDSQRKQIINLKNENSSISVYKTTSQALEKERLELQDKIIRLESLLAESKSNANVINNIDSSDTAVITRLKEEKLASDQQLDFLNSVIVDLQNKNEKLKIQLSAMESGVVNGEQSMEIVSPKKRVAPRLFCDICDEFDKHDTDDCPLQAMSDSPPPTHYHGDRKSTRPYCDTCEEFHTPCEPSILLSEHKEIESNEPFPVISNGHMTSGAEKEDSHSGTEAEQLKEFTDFIKALKDMPPRSIDAKFEPPDNEGEPNSKDTEGAEKCHPKTSDEENMAAGHLQETVTKTLNDPQNDSGICVDDSDHQDDTPGIGDFLMETRDSSTTNSSDSNIVSEITPANDSDNPEEIPSVNQEAPTQQPEEANEERGISDGTLACSDVLAEDGLETGVLPSDSENIIEIDNQPKSDPKFPVSTRNQIPSTSESDYMSGNEDIDSSGEGTDDVIHPATEPDESEDHIGITQSDEAVKHNVDEGKSLTAESLSDTGESLDDHSSRDRDSKDGNGRPESCVIS